MTGRMGVAILGTGWVSGEHIKAFQQNPHTEVCAILSRERERAEAKIREHGLAGCRAYTALDELLRNGAVQIVSICTPHHLHTPQGVACAGARRHILVEKPMALTLEEVRALDAAVREAGVKSLVSFVLRWNPLFETIQALLAQGLIGRLYMAEVDYLSNIGPWYRGYEWIRRKPYGGTNLLTSGCHAVDALRWFVGAEVEELFSYASTSAENPLRFEYDTNAETVLRFANGVIGKVGCTIEGALPYTFPVSLFGDQGVIRDNRIFTKRWPGQTGWATIPTILPDTAEVSHHPFEAEVNHFIECIVGGQESHCNVADAVKTHEICLAADISAREGRPVKLPLAVWQP